MAWCLLDSMLLFAPKITYRLDQQQLISLNFDYKNAHNFTELKKMSLKNVISKSSVIFKASVKYLHNKGGVSGHVSYISAADMKLIVLSPIEFGIIVVTSAVFSKDMGTMV